MYDGILLAVDLDRPASWAKSLPASIALARTFGARLTLCTVVTDDDTRLEAQWSPIAFRQLIETASATLGRIADAQDLPIETEVVTGSVWKGILDIAERIDADLIVLSSHDPATKDYLLGANASRVVRHAHCSVFVVRGPVFAEA
ncbi:MAG: universal stress protein [Allosphingosinicella sp.]